MSHANQAVEQEPTIVCPVCETLLTGPKLEAEALGLCTACRSLLQVPALADLTQRRDSARQWLARRLTVRTRAGHLIDGVTVGQVLRLLGDGRLDPSDTLRTEPQDRFHPLHADERIGAIDWQQGPTAPLGRIALMLAGTRAELLHDAQAGLSFVVTIPQRPRVQLRELRSEALLCRYHDDARALLAEQDAYDWSTDVSDGRAALLRADPMGLRLEREATSRLGAGETADPLQMDLGDWMPGAASGEAAVRFDPPKPVTEDQEVVVEPEPASTPVSLKVMSELLSGESATVVEPSLAGEKKASQKGEPHAPTREKDEHMPPTETLRSSDGIISFDDLDDDFGEGEAKAVPEARVVGPESMMGSVAELSEADLIDETEDSDKKSPPPPRTPPKKP